jgi:FkbM family methyltransferase
MFRSVLHRVFRAASRKLRYTPLRRVRWITDLHNRLFGLLSPSSTLRFRDFVLHVDPRDRVIAKKLSLYGEYEEFARELLLSLYVPGTAAIDVGANIGLHTILLSQIAGADGRVIAFEPDPENYRLLQRNILDNGLTNVTTHPVALSNVTGHTLLHQSTDNRGGLSLRAENADVSTGKGLEPVRIETAVGDDLLADLGRPVSLVKIDVEGAEPLVLEGLRNTLARNPSARVFFEFWPRFLRSFGVDPRGFLEGLERQGFSLSVVDTDARTITERAAPEIVNIGDKSLSALNLLAVRTEPAVVAPETIPVVRPRAAARSPESVLLQRMPLHP